MTAFSFSTGNPSNLTGGATASMTDISGSLTDLKTFLNAATITDTNVQAAGLTDTSLASPTNAVWRTVLTCPFILNAAGVALTTGVYWASYSGVNISGGGGNSAAMGVWNPPAAGDVAVASKTTRLRLRVPYAINGTVPGVNITWGLYPITNTAGGSSLISLTLGTVIAGSTAVATAPTINGTATGSSFDLSLVTGANAYIIGVTGSGTQSANSLVQAQPILEMRHT